jgi:ribosomal-protein-alanine N-acetyltransferase
MSRPELPLDFPLLTTDRLFLRSLDLTDVDAIYRHFSDPRVVEFLMPPLESKEDAETVVQELLAIYRARKGIFWALIMKVGGEFVGVCGFERLGPGNRGEVGFDLAAAMWGKGLMAEALTAVLNFGFDRLGLKEIFAITTPANHRALRLMKRLGFTPDGGKNGALQFSIKRRDWRLKNGDLEIRKSCI